MNAMAGLHTYSDWALLILRLGVGAIFWTHGRMKWGMWKMKPSDQLPASALNILRLLSICEPLGAIAVVLGFLTQLAGLGFAIIMLGAINYKARTQKLAFMDLAKGGWEFELLLLVAAVVLVIMGAGAFALDRAWFGA